MKALLSVSDKTGLVELARTLASQGYELIATGGTASAIKAAGIAVIEAGEVSGVGELMEGRVKTLSPIIFAGILSRRTPADRADLAKIGAHEIDLVICNLYPDEIDIGGVALIRAAAKNSEHVAVVVDPADYGRLPADASSRNELARKAWNYVAQYDARIASRFDDSLRLSFSRHQSLRYGENPHQTASWWKSSGPGVHDAVVHEGKDLSYNNLLDLSAAYGLAWELGENAVVIVKHQNPCGAARGLSASENFVRALACDSEAAFGGVVALRGRIDDAFVDAIGKLRLDVIVSGSFTPSALERLKIRKNTRLVEWPTPQFDELGYRSIPGGMLCQSPDKGEASEWRTVSERPPTSEERDDLATAEIIAKHVRSNAIVLVKGNASVGIGAGQMSRADSVRIAVMKAGERANGSVMASDAFFPFADGIEVARGVTAVVEPGGSVRDGEVIAAANSLGIALCFTGVRHFKH